MRPHLRYHNTSLKEPFHMTSRLPYWCPKTNETAATLTLVSQTSPVGDQPFDMKNLSTFVTINLHSCWPRGEKAL